MRSLILVGMVGLLGLGCSRRVEKTTPVAAPSLHKVAVVDTEGPAAPTVNYKELVQRLAQELRSADPLVRAEAIRQLRELDPALTYPFVLEAIKQPATRLAGLSALTPAQAQQHQKELVPLLLPMLQDKDPSVRRQVCECLTWVDRQLTGDQLQAGVQAQERLGALRMTAEKDEDENVRQAARDSVRMVQDAIKGRFGATAEAAGEEGGGATGDGGRGGLIEAPRRDIPKPKKQ